MRTRRARRLALVAACMVAPFWLASCGSDSVTGPGGGSELASINVTASVIGTPVATIVIEVSAPNINPSLVFNLQVNNGIASGTISVPPGNARLVTGRAYDSRGDLTHEGSTTIEVRPGNNPSISLNLLPRAGQVPIIVRLGAPTIAIHSSSSTVTVGNSLPLSATITGPDGNPVSGTVSWATVNPTVATVSSTGSVTGVWEGTTLIVATFGGSAATMSVTVPSCVQAYTIPSSVTGTLQAGDCRRQSNGFFPSAADFGDNQLMDIYGASIPSQRSLQVNLTGSVGFDAFAVQDNGARTVVAFNDDGAGNLGGGSQYHVIMAPGDYLFAASVYSSGTTGAYTFATSDVLEDISGCTTDYTGIPNSWVTAGVTTNQSLSASDCGGGGTGPVSDGINFATVVNQVVTVTVRSATVPVNLAIHPSTGANIAVAGTFSGGFWTATSTFVAGSTGINTMTVSTNGSGHNLGPYTLTVQ